MSAIAVCVVLAAAFDAAAQAPDQAPALRIVVLEGEDSVNIIERGTAVPTLVEVRDRNDLPVSGASVLFLLGEGGTATLNAGLQQVALTTNALGQAAVTVNPIASGAVQLSVNAAYQGQTAAAAIVQTNFATVAEAAAAGVTTAGGTGGGGGAGGAAAGGGAGAGGGLGTGALVGIIGGAVGAAAGVGVAVAGGDDASPPARPDPPAASPPSAPSAPRLEAGDGRLVVRWDAPADDGGASIDGYDVRYRSVGGGWQPSPDGMPSTATTVTIPNLTNGTSYEVQVRARNSAGDGAWSVIATGRPVAAASPPSAPSAPRLEAGDGRLVVRWDAPADDGGASIDGYDVRYRSVGGGWQPSPDGMPSTATTVRIPNLANGTAYEVQVRASNSAGDGSWSSIATGTPVAAARPPSAPSGLRLEAGDGRLVVRWNAPADDGGASIDGYDVQYWSDEGAWIVKSTETTVTIEGLTNGTEYQVQVRARNSAGDGPSWSEIATGTPVAAARPPSAPSGLRLEAGDGRLVVRWNAPADDGGAAIDGYDVQYWSDEGAWIVKSTETTVTIEGLTNGTEYHVQVGARNSAGDGAWSVIATGRPVAAASPPSAPSGLRLEAGDGRLVVRWNAPADDGGAAIDGYDVQYWSDEGAWIVKSTETTVTIEGLTNGTEYHVQVRARNSAGDGPSWSEIATGTPVAPAPMGDRAVLIELYNATNGENWTNNTNWNSGAPLDQWSGVVPDGSGRVTRLNLASNNLDGKIPESLGNLTKLERLDLYDNNLRGSIPESFRYLTNLEYFNLSVNGLSGSIPDWWHHLTNLRYFAIAFNDLRGSIPESFRYLTNLEYFNLNANGLSGSIPDWWHHLTNLEYLHIANHDLRGSIPNSLRHLTNLKELHIGGDLSGSIPDWLSHLTNLEILRFTGNHSRGLGLSGSIPDWLRHLTNLEWLDLSGNNLSGSIPDGLRHLTNLEQLDLHDNNLSGSIPDGLRHLTNLEWLDLSGNNLSGTIPAALCKSGFEINPQQGGVNLPCAASSNLTAAVAPGDRKLVVSWTAESANGKAVGDYDVRYRPENRSAAWTSLAAEAERTATSATITGLTNGTVYQVQVRAGEGEWSATASGTPAEPVEGVGFGDAGIEDQRYRQYAAIAPLVLPAATGGAGALTYALAPALPMGLAFDAASRTVSGTPAVASAPTTYTYTAASGGADQASLSFTIEVEASAEEDALRRDALAAQGRALLSSVTGVIGERFRPRREPGGGESGPGGAAAALGAALASMTGAGAGGWSGGGAGPVLMPGAGVGAHPVRSAVGSVGVPAAGAAGAVGGAGGTLSGVVGGGRGVPGMGAGFGPGEFGVAGVAAGASGVGAGGWDGLLWGQSFAAALPTVGGDGSGVSRYTVWGAGDSQSFSGTPAAGRYSGDLRTLYVGADGRIGADWLAGAAVGTSWGAAEYAAASGGGATGRLTTRLTSLYPYVQGQVSSGLELWAIGGYGWGEARDARGTDARTEAPGAAGDLRMKMGAAGLRQEVLEAGGVALAVVGGAGSLSLSTAGGGLTVRGLAARVHRGQVAVEASRASGAVSPFVQLGGRYDGGDGQTGAGLEVVAGLRASTARVDLEARGRWLTVHSATGYGEYGAALRVAVKSRPDGTGWRGSLAPRWGAAESGGMGQDGLLGGTGVSDLHPGAAWMPGSQALSLDGELGYGWRTRRLPGVVSPVTSYRRTGLGGELTRVGVAFLSAEEALRGNLRMEFTLGRERWLAAERPAYQLALLVSSSF